ncbi:hypothetical protein ACJX0J_019338, partial [Zea mays]
MDHVLCSMHEQMTNFGNFVFAFILKCIACDTNDMIIITPHLPLAILSRSFFIKQVKHCCHIIIFINMLTIFQSISLKVYFFIIFYVEVVVILHKGAKFLKPTGVFIG